MKLTEDMTPEEWCPTQNGSSVAYLPEYWDDTEWKTIPTTRDKRGIPSPLFLGGVYSTVGLMGYAQAMGIAWGMAAIAESEGRELLVRVQAYRIVYDIKAQKIPEDTGASNDQTD